jgi:hypothetical protein
MKSPRGPGQAHLWPATPRHGRGRIAANGLVEIRNGAVEIGSLQQSQRAILVDVDLAPWHDTFAAPAKRLIRAGQRVNRDCGGEIGDGAIGIAALPPKHAAIVVSE